MLFDLKLYYNKNGIPKLTYAESQHTTSTNTLPCRFFLSPN